MRTNLTENGERNVVKGENHMENNRAQWGSKIGFILAAAGSAVGLGNIWKFLGKPLREAEAPTSSFIWPSSFSSASPSCSRADHRPRRAGERHRQLPQARLPRLQVGRRHGCCGGVHRHLLLLPRRRLGAALCRVLHYGGADGLCRSARLFLRPARLQRRDGRDMVPADRHSLCRGLYGSQRLHHHQGR